MNKCPEHKRPAAVAIACWQALSNLGNTPEQMKQALSSAESLLQTDDRWLTQNRPIQAGHIHAPLLAVPAALQAYASRNVAIALTLLHAMRDPLAQHTAHFARQRLGIVIGTSTSGMADNEAAIFAWHNQRPAPQNFDYRKQQMNATSLVLQHHLGWCGPCFTISTACSSAAKTFLAGQRLL